MSISMNNHESRIKALENTGLNSKYEQNRGYLRVGDVTINYGFNDGEISGNATVKFLTPFKSTNYAALCILIHNGMSNYGYGYLIPNTRTKTGCQFVTESVSHSWLAIGYLITNRLLSHIHEVMSYGITK